MRKEAKTEPAEVCPRCGEPMELVHFGADPAGLLVFHGAPPAGLLELMARIVTGSRVRTESGAPVLFGFASGQVPGMHCKHCRQITVRYSA